MLSYTAVRRHACQSGLLYAAQALRGRALLLLPPTVRRRRQPRLKVRLAQRPPRGGGKKYLREKFSNPTSDGKKKRREREKEDVGRCACVSACPSVRRREKCQLSHECPTSLPDGGQPLQPPVILATIRAEDKDIAHWNTTMSKVRKLLIFFT